MTDALLICELTGRFCAYLLQWVYWNNKAKPMNNFKSKMHEQLEKALVALEQMDTGKWLEIEKALKALKEDETLSKSEDDLFVCNCTIVALFMKRARIQNDLRVTTIFLIQKLLKGDPVVIWEYQVYQVYSPKEDETCSTECVSHWGKPFVFLEEAITCLNATAFTGYIRKWQVHPLTGKSSRDMVHYGDIAYRKTEGTPRFTEGRRKTIELAITNKIFQYQGKTWRALKIDTTANVVCEDATPLVECEEVLDNPGTFPSRESFPIRTVRQRLHLNEWGQPMCILTEPRSIPTKQWELYADSIKIEIEGKKHTFSYVAEKGECLLPVILT